MKYAVICSWYQLVHFLSSDAHCPTLFWGCPKYLRRGPSGLHLLQHRFCEVVLRFLDILQLFGRDLQGHPQPRRGVCRLQDFSICIRSSANSWTTFISLSSHAKANQAFFEWREMANGRANAQRRKSQGKRLKEPPNHERLISINKPDSEKSWEHMGTC